MRATTFLFSLVLLAVWVVGLSSAIPVGQRTLPKLGALLSPYQGFLQQAEARPDQSIQNTLQAGLNEPVQVHFDQRLVPHIFANNLKDAYHVLGHLHAKYRLFQTDLVCRSTAGRLSEILGPRLLERDQLQRRKGMAWSAQKAVEQWKKSEDFPLMEAYSKGYNEYISSMSKKDWPIEFKLLDYEPEPWSPYKMALLLKSMAQTLCSRNYDIASTNTFQKLGPEMFESLYPIQMSEADPIVPEQVEYPFIPLLPDKAIQVPNIEDLIGHTPLPNPPAHIGSNNWAVAGSKTKSGYPILANDPHLSLTLPSIWYEAHIITPDVNTYGVSLPGFPGIIIGFNKHIAWGMTNVGQDVTDWYEIKWVDESKNKYWLDGEKKEVERKIERYDVKGIGTISDTVTYTHWGPIVMEGSGNNQPDLAMQWLPHFDPDPSEIEIFTRLNHAKNFDDYTKASQNLQSPPQNVVFASNSGDIAIRVQGRFPLKKDGQGRFVNKGDETKNGWQGFVPMDHNPAMLNPERGFVSSANQKSTDNNYPYYYNGRFEQYRGRILNRKLAKMEAIEVDDMRKLQYDEYSLKAEEFTPLLLKYLDRKTLDNADPKIISDLKNWDFKYAASAEVPTFFELWLAELKDGTWDEVESEPGGSAMLSPQDWVLRDLLIDDPSHVFFDHSNTPNIEVATDVVSAAYMEAEKKFSELKKESRAAWRKYNVLSIPHLSRIPAFGKTSIQMGGSKHCLNASNKNFGPSWRMVVELGPEQRAFGVYPGGQSGNPGSPYYDTGIETWSKGELNELQFAQQPNDLDQPLFIHQFNPK